MFMKYKDLGCPIISYTIGNTVIDEVLLDLGANMNLLPYSIYKQLGVSELKPTKIAFQLADRSIKVPKGEIKYVLIKVGEFNFLVDFIIFKTQSIQNPIRQIPIILGDWF